MKVPPTKKMTVCLPQSINTTTTITITMDKEDKAQEKALWKALDANEGVECSKCGYGWIPRVKQPKSCPRCKTRFDYPKP